MALFETASFIPYPNTLNVSFIPIITPYEDEYDIIKFQKAGQPQNKTVSTAPAQNDSSNDSKSNENKAAVQSKEPNNKNTDNPAKTEIKN